MEIFERIAGQPLPFAELLGIEVVSAAADRIVGRMMVRDDLCTRPAVLHGGAIMAFADTLGAVGTIANLPEGAGYDDDRKQDQFCCPGAGRHADHRRGDPDSSRQTDNDLADADYQPEGRLVALVTQTQLVL